MDIALLLRQLEFADFSTRQKLAEAAARALDTAQLPELARQLEHPQERVRLGLLDILWRAGYRAGLEALLAHARKRTGDDRIFAIRALAQLARPGDESLHAPTREWLTSSDPFVSAQAKLLARALALGEGPAVAGPTAAPVAAPAAPAPAPARAPVDPIAALLAARTDGERIALVAAIEQRGSAELSAAAALVLPMGNADVVALLCRALIRKAKAIPAVTAQELVPLLEAARARLDGSFVALAAVDDGLLALQGLAVSSALLENLATLDADQVDQVLGHLHDGPAPELALYAPLLLRALEKKPALWPAVGPVLVDAAPHLREGARADLRVLCEAALSELRQGRALPPLTLLSVCWILAQISERGEPVCRQLRMGLEELAIAEAALAASALYARLATEEAALALVSLLRDPLPEARAAAREALDGFESPWVRVSFPEPERAPELSARYEAAQGTPLSRKDGRLFAVASGEEYALAAQGRPIRVSETEHGGCLCCAPRRALARRKGEGLRCLASWESYLREGGRVMRERDHPLGRCRHCDSSRPRVREETRIVCLECGFGRSPENTAPPPPAAAPLLPSESAGRSDDDECLPRPPTPQELELIAPHIRAAIVANVFLQARDGDAGWSGSGIIIARDGAHVAILTNRHVVEDDASRRLAALRALTVAGELVTVTTAWRAERGVDLALVEGTVEQPEALGVMALGSGGALVGAALFAVGNPHGLAWSYTSGTLSAVRHWNTHEGQSVRILQTDAQIASGSSGGGLFDSQGRLLGVISFGHRGGAAHFALSMEAIRDAFAREGVAWHGRPLLAG